MHQERVVALHRHHLQPFVFAVWKCSCGENSAPVQAHDGSKVAASAEIIKSLSEFTEREIEQATGVMRKTVRQFRNGGTITIRIYRKLMTFLRDRIPS